MTLLQVALSAMVFAVVAGLTVMTLRRQRLDRLRARAAPPMPVDGMEPVTTSQPPRQS